MSEFHPHSDKEMNTYGGMLAASIFGNTVLSTSLLVIQMVLVLYGVSRFFASPKDRRKGRLRFIIISCLMLAMCAIDRVFDSWNDFLVLYTGGPDGISYLQAYGALGVDWRWQPIGDAFLSAAIVLGEILMLWRCLVLWTDRKWVVLFPFLVFLGSTTSDIAYIVGNITANVGLRSTVALTAAILRVALNIMITFLIVLRVMRARSRTAKAFPNQKPPRWYSGVAALVVESAAPLAIFGICFIALKGTILSESPRQIQSGRILQRGRHNIATDVTSAFYYAFCTLSPQMIIVRVTRGKAWDSKVVEATDEGENLSQPIRFARSARETTTSNISASV
ncbi:hypothetical protein BKA70DRAFT_1283251 [Coprinopsis sp. MPI-PUGE-AT-0042]|nr:hypothetical protein BKA70DRAFT_1283251 [Coprinopsis sp. MPI-PUGE-AT-0042]